MDTDIKTASPCEWSRGCPRVISTFSDGTEKLGVLPCHQCPFDAGLIYHNPDTSMFVADKKYTQAEFRQIAKNITKMGDSNVNVVTMDNIED